MSREARGKQLTKSLGYHTFHPLSPITCPPMKSWYEVLMSHLSGKVMYC